MKTPALKEYLNKVGKIVHHLNTTAVGLSAVESGEVEKPDSMDISWAPSDCIASGRQARAFVLRATLVMVAEELNSYVSDVAMTPGFNGFEFSNNASKSVRFIELAKYCSLPSGHLTLGPLLILHWRNRIVHARTSNSSLSKSEKQDFCKDSLYIKEHFKNLDVQKLLQDFKECKPTLKDVSSLVAMSIQCVKLIDKQCVEPSSKAEVLEWFKYMKLEDELLVVQKKALGRGNDKLICSFIRTHIPAIEEAYFRYFPTIGSL